MRIGIFAALLLAGVAAPALAQDAKIDRRIQKLEGEMRAVQRKVFPGGAGAVVQPEIRPEATSLGAAGVPATSAVSDLTARVDALEAQLARLTGQAEENANRLRQLDADFAALRSSTEARLAERERPAVQAQPAAEPVEQAQSKSALPAAVVSTGDPGEDAYLTGFRLWETGHHAEAHEALEAMIKKYPKHRRASHARNLAGRALLESGKPASAAKLLLANYQTNPKGERAADSLYFLGQALVKLDKGSEACKVYDELKEVYPTMRDWLRERLPAARSEAGCN